MGPLGIVGGAVLVATGLTIGALLGFGFRDHLAEVLERILDWPGPQ